MVSEKVILNIETQNFPVTIIISQINSNCASNLDEDIVISNYNQSTYIFDFEMEDDCQGAEIKFTVIDSEGCTEVKATGLVNPCKSFVYQVAKVTEGNNITARVTGNGLFWVEWYEDNVLIGNDTFITLPNGSGDIEVVIKNQKGCTYTEIVSFINLTIQDFAKTITDCNALPTQINFSTLISPSNTPITSIQLVTPAAHATTNIVGNNILVYAQEDYFLTAVVDEFDVLVTTANGTVTSTVTMSIDACVDCITGDDVTLNFAYNIDNDGNVTYTANKNAIPNNPQGIVSDLVYISTNLGQSWALGDAIAQCDAFNSMGKFFTECSNPYTNAVEWTIKGRLCGSGYVAGPLYFKEKNTGNIIQSYPSANIITTANGESITTGVSSIYNWNGIIAQFSYTMNDGFVKNVEFEYTNTFTSASDAGDCNGNPTNVVTAVGDHKIIWFKRVVTFDNGCQEVSSTYSISIIETDNVLPNPTFIEGVKIA